MVEVEADYLNRQLVPDDDPILAAIRCPRVLADEIVSNLQSLKGVGDVTVDRIMPMNDDP